MRHSIRLLVLVASLPASAGAAAEEAAQEVRKFAVRTLPGADEIVAAVRSGSFERWYASQDPAAELVAGPDAAGDVEIEAQVLPADERLRQRLAGLPVDLSGEALVFDGTPYPGPGTAFMLRLPEAGKPTWAVLGYDAESVANLADQVLWSHTGGRFRRGRPDGDYLVRESYYSERSGRWRKTADGWTVDPEERDDMTARAATYAALVALERPRLVLRVPPERADDPALARLADDLDAAVRRMAGGVPLEVERPLEVVVEQDYVDMGRHLAAIGETVVDAEGRLHLVHHPDDFDAYVFGAARLLIRRAGLAPPPRLEDGAALWLAGRWYGRPWSEWLPDLAFGRVLPEADEVFADVPRDHRSEVLWPPVMAALVDRLDGETVRAKLARIPSSARVAEALAGLARGTAGKDRARRPSAGSGFHHGVSFAMRNGLEVGYHAPGVDGQLARLARLGADSVSLMPFAGQPSPNEPGLGYYNGSPSSETDAGMVHAARRAHAHGFRVLWKPHIWVRHDSWPGEIAMTSEEDWALWWSQYRRYVLRHAVLAEWTGSELFSVGVELGKTVGREAEWRHLIRAVRRIFTGRVTYAGNWWGDYDRVPFWDELDYVGVDAYFPLAHDIGADRAALEAGARRAVDELRKAAERYGKPVILTEVGFAAKKGAWVSPHEEGGELSEEHQALAYEVLLGALGRPDWLHGLYVWKAFSHPSIEAGDRPDFHFLERGAEEAVRAYFRAGAPAVVPTAD
jgi:hypothetical protein